MPAATKCMSSDLLTCAGAHHRLVADASSAHVQPAERGGSLPSGLQGLAHRHLPLAADDASSHKARELRLAHLCRCSPQARGRRIQRSCAACHERSKPAVRTSRPSTCARTRGASYPGRPTWAMLVGSWDALELSLLAACIVTRAVLADQHRQCWCGTLPLPPLHLAPLDSSAPACAQARHGLQLQV